MNPIIDKYFIPDVSQKKVLSNGTCRLYSLGEKNEGRTSKAFEQATLTPVLLETVFCYVNEFLNYIVDNPIEPTKSGSIILDKKAEDIIGHGIWVRDSFTWKPPSRKWPYVSPDNKYKAIQNYYNLNSQKDLIWIKFTEDGYVGVVCDSSDINHSYKNTSGRLIQIVKKRWDTSNVFIFPITSAMTKYKSRKQIETGIGQYLIGQGVPIIDYFSHNNL